MKKSTISREQAAKIMASIGGSSGTGAAKRRSSEHYARLARRKKVEKALRLEGEKEKPDRKEVKRLEKELQTLIGPK